MPAESIALPRAGRPRQLSLLGMPKAELVEFFENIGEKPYRARQIMRWLYQRHVTDYAQMSDLSSAEWQSTATDPAIARVIAEGKPPMPAFGQQLNPRGIDAMVRYVRALGPASAP